MAGNSIGKNFVVTTAGESHGPALVAIVDGCPSGLELSEQDFEGDIARRKTGASRYTSQRHEPDTVKILSGVFAGKTTGTPIALMIENRDQRPRDYSKIKDLFRPGHADYTYFKKYSNRDYRGGGRSSARETVMRVAAGVIAKKYLQQQIGLKIFGYVSQIGNIRAEKVEFKDIEQNPFFFPDKTKINKIQTYIKNLLREGDSIGAKIHVVAQNIPVGLGEPIFEKLDAEIAAAMMGINAVKGVEVGDGFAVITQKGSQHRDEMQQNQFTSNHAGGTLGGISSGQDILVQLAFKPTSSIRIPGKTQTATGEATEVVTTGRHDPCVGFRAVPIAEAMLAIVLMDHYLRHKIYIE